MEKNKDDIRSILSERRKELGYTMKDVAKLVGVSEATISRWESGDIANMRRDRISKLADALKISPAVIMGWENSPSHKGYDFHLFDNDKRSNMDSSDNSHQTYYLDPAAAQLAQELFERPEMRVLFDASRNASKEDIEQVASILEKMSGGASDD